MNLLRPGTGRGLLWMLLSTIGFSISHLIVRYVSPEIHSSQSVFFRGFFGLFVLLPLFMRQGKALFRTRQLRLHVVRAVFSVSSLTCFYYALTAIPLAKATAIGFFAPVVVSLMAVVFFKERSRLVNWLSLAMGVAGMLLVLRPGTIPLDVGTVLMILSTILFSINLTVIKVLGREDSSTVITSYITVLLIPLSLPMAISVWVWPDTGQLVLLAIMGIINIMSLILFTQAMQEAATSIIMPLDFLRLVWMALFGYLFFFELPDVWTWIGGLVIFIGALLVAVPDRPKSPLFRA